MYKAPKYSVRVEKKSIKGILQINGKRLWRALCDYESQGFKVISIKKIKKGAENVSSWYTIV